MAVILVNIDRSPDIVSRQVIESGLNLTPRNSPIPRTEIVLISKTLKVCLKPTVSICRRSASPWVGGHGVF